MHRKPDSHANDESLVRAYCDAFLEWIESGQADAWESVVSDGLVTP